MSTLLDSVTQQLGGGTMNQIAQQIGADPQTTNNAVQMALPMLLGGLATNASSPQGAQALDTALADHDPSLLDNLGSMLGGGGAPAGASALGGLGGGGLGGMLGGILGGGGAGGGIGGAILGHVLGGRQAGVTDGVSRATGMQPAQVGQLLMILAPIVMAALAKRKQEAGVHAGNIGSVLEQEQQQAVQRSPGLGGLLGSVFGGGAGGGNVADDIARMGPSVLGGLFGGR